VLGFDQRSLRESGTLEAMIPRRFPLFQSIVRGDVSGYSNALFSVAKCIESRNNFTLFAKIFLKIFRRKAWMLKAAGKRNLAGHLLSQSAEGVLGDRDIAPLCSEPFKSQQVYAAPRVCRPGS
jgi:hypothetical protein